ncbi:MAG: T9SS type A sorting domain-containing protein [Bacteroidales bacterium]
MKIYLISPRQNLSAGLMRYLKIVVVFLVVGMSIGRVAWGANRYSVAIGDWNSTSTWAATSGGTAGVSVPVAGDVVYIQNGKNVTVTTDAAAASITFTGAAATLTINSGATLSVAGAVILLHNIGNSTACLITGNGTLSCNSVEAGSNLTLNTSGWSAIITSTLNSFNISGNVTMIAKDITPYGQAGFRVEDGTTSVAGQITSSLGSNNVAALRMNGVTTGLQTGTLVLSGSTPFGILTYVTVVLNGTGSTVVYNCGGAQTILNKTYTNLTLAGSGIKALTSAVIVNSVLSMQGTATCSGVATYGTNSSLEYNGSSSQTTGPEWPTSFTKPVAILNTSNVVTIGTATFTGTSATTTINTGATLATGAGTFTAAGPMAINGSFQINTGGYAAGNTWTYTNGTLIFNKSDGYYGVNNADVFWPTTNGPTNVTVLQGGLTLGATNTTNRTITGIFQTSAGVSINNSSVLTISGTCKLNAGGFFNQAPTYGSSSTLIYNTGSNFAAGQEWYPNNSGTGPGVPQNVTIAAGTSLYFDGTNTYRLMRGDLNFSTPFPSTSTLALSGTNGGDLYIGGNWNKASGGVFAANGRLVKFNGTNSQTITSSGGETFDYFEVANSAGVVLASNVTANSTLTFTSGKLAIGANTLTIAGIAAAMSASNSLVGSLSSNLILNGSGATGSLYFDQATPGTTNALQNFTINRTSSGTATLGNTLVVDGTLTLTDGTLSGSIGYGADGILTYNGTSYSSTSDVEFPASAGPKTVNITSASATGISLHANRTLAGNMTISSGQKFIIPANTQLTVSGALSNAAGTSGLVIKSDAAGTGSLNHSTAGVAATVERYFTGSAESWHQLSSPVAAQEISGGFTPSGTYPDGSGYDFFARNEPTSNWINRKNLSSSLPVGTAPYFDIVNSGLNFQVGRGYLVAYQATNPTKIFTGILNQGDLTIPLTNTGTGTSGRTNLAGNPYPSAIDWKAASIVKSDLQVETGGGYNIYIYNQSANNYGVYNDIITGDDGTNLASRYIPSMQGFFVTAKEGTLGGGLVLKDAARVNNTHAWMKEEGSSSLVLKITAPQNAGSDETMITFGNASDLGGAGKWFSLVNTAPSLYTSKDGMKYSINFLSSVSNNPVVPADFKAGVDGSYAISARYNPGAFGQITLEDVVTGIKTELRNDAVYNFEATTSDPSNRFLLHFAGVGIGETTTPRPVSFYAVNNSICISNKTSEALAGNISVYSMMGQLMMQQPLSGINVVKMSINAATGYYLVKVVTNDKVYSGKVFIHQQ